MLEEEFKDRLESYRQMVLANYKMIERGFESHRPYLIGGTYVIQRQKFDLIYKAEDLLWVTKPIPLALKIGRAKPKKADLNSFINLGHRKQQNSVKQAYAKYLRTVLPDPPEEPYTDRVKFLFTYMAPDRRIRDLGNMCAMVDKFTSDVVVDLGFITDDSTRHIHNIHFAYAGLDENKFNHARLYIFKDYDL